MHPDNAFLATHDECTLAYPSFTLSIDDTHDCVIPCQAAPAGRTPDFVDSPLVTSTTNTSNYGHAFQAPCRGRKFVPFPQTKLSLDNMDPAD
jgi:hypothetical protein